MYCKLKTVVLFLQIIEKAKKKKTNKQKTTIKTATLTTPESNEKTVRNGFQLYRRNSLFWRKEVFNGRSSYSRRIVPSSFKMHKQFNKQNG